MTNFFVAILFFILFFVVFYGATKLMAFASRKRKEKGSNISGTEENP